jgi:hypothetical protein
MERYSMLLARSRPKHFKTLFETLKELLIDAASVHA